MASPTFIVFQDRSLRSPEEAAEILRERGLTRTAPPPNAHIDDGDKENISPVTGKRTRPGPNKKLSKMCSTKAQVDSSGTKPQSQKRKSIGEGKPTARKDGSRKVRKTSKRHSPSFSLIDKERESEKEIERILLNDIEARCYELTVKPLADLSEAFGCPQAFIPEGQATCKDDEMSMDKDHDFDFDPPPTPPPTPIKSSLRHTTPFSTPERKLVFPAFTFASPSPSAEKFKKAKSFGRGSTRACSSP